MTSHTILRPVSTPQNLATTASPTFAGLTLTSPLAVAQGGTGSANASDARTALGLAIGTNVQAYDADLAALAGVTSAADKVPYFTGSGAASVADFTASGRAMVATASAAAQTALLSAFTGDSGAGGVKGLVPAPITGDGSKYLKGDGTWTAIPGGGDLLAANNLSDLANAGTARTNLGLAIGTNVQAYDAELAAIAGLTSAADKGIQFTGSGTAGVYDLTAAGKALLDDADASAQRTTLGLVIGTNVQAYDADLAALAGLTSAADKVPYFTGSGTAAVADFTAGGRALVNSAGTADTFPYFSASNTVTLGSITAAGRALLDDADASAQRTTLGLAIGTNVQAFDATLTAFAAYNTNGLLTQTAADTFTGRTLTGTANQVVISNGDGVSGNPTFTLPQSIATSSAVQFGTAGLGAALTAASGIGTPRFGVTTGSWSEFNSSRPAMVQFQRDFTEPPDSSPGAVQDVFRVYVSSHQSGTVAQGRIGITSRMTDSASVVNKTITNAVSNGGPDLIRITATGHGFSTSDVINIYGVGGTTEANGVWTITVIDANTFDLQGSTHTNAYTSGGTATNRGLMYAFRGIVNPTLDRGTTTGTGANGDDINAFVAVNTGAGRATEAFYVGESTGVGTGAGAQVGWYAGFAMASDADYGILVTNEQPAASAVTGLPAAAGAFWPTYTPNDTTTETRRTLSLKPTLNAGGSNTNKTLNVLEIDTTNTAATGFTTNLISASYGGSARLTLSSGGALALTGSQTVSTSLQAATASVTTASGTGVFNVGSPTQSPMAMNILSTDQGTLSLQRILAGTGGAGFNGYKARGSGVGSESVALSADVVMNIAGFGYDAATSGQAWPTTATVQLRGLATENHSTTAHGGKLELRTTPEGSTTIATRATFGTTGVSIGSSTAARSTTEPTNALNIFDGTAPVGTLTNGCTFYSTSGEMRVMDAAGNATLLSPHDKRTNRWIFDSHVGKGKKRTRIIVQMEQMMRKLNDMLGGGYIREMAA